MNLERAERCFHCAALFIAVCYGLYFFLAASAPGAAAYSFVLAALLFWSLSFHATRVLLREVAVRLEGGNGGVLRLLWALLVEGAALYLLVYCFQQMSSPEARHFAFATIAYLFCGSFFMLLLQRRRHKSK